MFIYDDVTKANLLNDFYSSVFINDNGTLPEFVRRVDEHCSLSDVTFSPDIIFIHLNKLKTKSSGGPDGLASIFIYHVARIAKSGR